MFLYLFFFFFPVFVRLTQRRKTFNEKLKKLEQVNNDKSRIKTISRL